MAYFGRPVFSAASTGDKVPSELRRRVPSCRDCVLHDHAVDRSLAKIRRWANGHDRPAPGRPLPVGVESVTLGYPRDLALLCHRWCVAEVPPGDVGVAEAPGGTGRPGCPSAAHLRTCWASGGHVRQAMNEALAVWNPFADELLSHWLETVASGRVLARTPDAGWQGRGAALLDRYRELATVHTRCGKHRRPKENLAILRTALEETTAGRELDARRCGLLQRTIDAMVRRRGRPGTSPPGSPPPSPGCTWSVRAGPSARTAPRTAAGPAASSAGAPTTTGCGQPRRSM